MLSDGGLNNNEREIKMIGIQFLRNKNNRIVAFANDYTVDEPFAVCFGNPALASDWEVLLEDGSNDKWAELIVKIFDLVDIINHGRTFLEL